MIKGEFHVVEYLGWETTYTEVRTCQAGIVKVKNRVRVTIITNFHFIILFLSFLQIVPIERLRSKSQEPPLNKMTFNKVDIALPSEIKEYYATTPEEKQAELHADFKNAINASKIHFEKVFTFSSIHSS